MKDISKSGSDMTRYVLNSGAFMIEKMRVEGRQVGHAWLRSVEAG